MHKRWDPLHLWMTCIYRSRYTSEREYNDGRLLLWKIIQNNENYLLHYEWCNRTTFCVMFYFGKAHIKVSLVARYVYKPPFLLMLAGGECTNQRAVSFFRKADKRIYTSLTILTLSFMRSKDTMMTFAAPSQYRQIHFKTSSGTTAFEFSPHKLMETLVWMQEHSLRAGPVNNIDFSSTLERASFDHDNLDGSEVFGTGLLSVLDNGVKLEYYNDMVKRVIGILINDPTLASMRDEVGVLLDHELIACDLKLEKNEYNPRTNSARILQAKVCHLLSLQFAKVIIFPCGSLSTTMRTAINLSTPPFELYLEHQLIPYSCSPCTLLDTISRPGWSEDVDELKEMSFR